jgi:hypothetical protein
MGMGEKNQGKFMIMKPHMYLNTQTQYYNNQSHVGSIMPLKSKLYNDETLMIL